MKSSQQPSCTSVVAAQHLAIVPLGLWINVHGLPLRCLPPRPSYFRRRPVPSAVLLPVPSNVHNGTIWQSVKTSVWIPQILELVMGDFQSVAVKQQRCCYITSSSPFLEFRLKRTELRCFLTSHDARRLFVPSVVLLPVPSNANVQPRTARRVLFPCPCGTVESHKYRRDDLDPCLQNDGLTDGFTRDGQRSSRVVLVVPITPTWREYHNAKSLHAGLQLHGRDVFQTDCSSSS